MKFWKKYKKPILWIIDLIVNVGVIVGIFFLVIKFIIAPFDIYGPSMCDNLNIIDGECTTEYGEKLIINKAGYYVSDPQRGDIIIFKPTTSDEKYFVKRILGLPGETVEILNGHVYITNKENPTGIKIEEPYLNKTNTGNTQSFPAGYKIFQIPENEYFVLGDNRNSSTDSRSCFQNPYTKGCEGDVNKAFVPKENISGRAWIVVWPVSNWRTLDRPEYTELTQNSSLEAK